MALDAPLSGTGAQAQTGDLVVFASGDSATIASLMPMFAGFSREAHDLGAFGNGSRMKFVANLLVAINNVASAEAMVLAEKAGLDLRQVVKLVGAGAAQSRIFDLRAPMMAGQSLFARHDAIVDLAEGHGCHRGVRERARLAYALPGDHPDL